MPPRGRVPFSEKDDENLVRYIADFGSEAGRKGNHLYQQLHGNASGLWPWSARHTFQSWRDRYVKNSDYFDRRIRRYQKQQASKQSVPNQENNREPSSREEVSEEEDALHSPRKRKHNARVNNVEKGDKRRKIQTEIPEGKIIGQAKVDTGEVPGHTVHADSRHRKHESVRMGHPTQQRSGRTAAPRGEKGKASANPTSRVLVESSTEEEEEEEPAPRLIPPAENDDRGQNFGDPNGQDDVNAEEDEVNQDPEANEDSSSDDNEIDHMLTDKIDEDFDGNLNPVVGHAGVSNASSSYKYLGQKLYPTIEEVPHPTTLQSDLNVRKPFSASSAITSSTAFANSHYLKPKFVSRKVISDRERGSSDAQTTAVDSGFFEASSPSVRDPISTFSSASPQTHEVTKSKTSHLSPSSTPTARVKTLPKLVENPFGGNHLAGSKFKSLHGAADSESDSTGDTQRGKHNSLKTVASAWPPVRNHKGAGGGPPSSSSLRISRNKAEQSRNIYDAPSSAPMPLRALVSKVTDTRQRIQVESTRNVTSRSAEIDSGSGSVDKQQMGSLNGQAQRSASRISSFSARGKTKAVAIVDSDDGDDEEGYAASETAVNNGEAEDGPLFTQPSRVSPLFTQPSQYDGPLFTQTSRSPPTSPPHSSRVIENELVTTEPATSDSNEEPLFTQLNSHSLHSPRTSPTQRPSHSFDLPQRRQTTPRPLLVSTSTAESVIKALNGFLKEVDQTTQLIRQGEKERRTRETERKGQGENLDAHAGRLMIDDKAIAYRDRGSPVPALLRKRSEIAFVKSIESRDFLKDSSNQAGHKSLLPHTSIAVKLSRSGKHTSRAAGLIKRKGEHSQDSESSDDVRWATPHPMIACRSDVRPGAGYLADSLAKRGQLSRESPTGVHDQFAHEGQVPPLDRTTKQLPLPSSPARDMNTAGPSRYTEHIASSTGPFIQSSHSVTPNPPLSRNSNPSKKGKEKAETGQNSLDYDINHSHYTSGSMDGPRLFPRGPKLDLQELAHRRASRRSSRPSASSASSPPPSKLGFAVNSSKSPIKLSANDQYRLIDANVERMAREYNFPPDYVCHIWKETEDLDVAEEILRELRNMSAALLDKSRRRSSTSRRVDGEPPGELETVHSPSPGVDVRAVSGSKHRHSHHRQRVSEKFALKVTDQGFESDYSPPAVSRAGQLVRLTEQGRAAEALEREKRRATISNGTFIVQQDEGRRLHTRPSSVPADVMEIDSPAQNVRDNSRTIEALMATEDLDEIFFSNSRKGEQRAQELTKRYGPDLMVELAAGALNKYFQ